MALTPLTAQSARTLCELSGWRLSNLPLQKLLYLSHMISLGEANRPLVGTPFQAWNLGPVEPSLYHQVKAFGDKPISDVFGCKSFVDGSSEYKILESVFMQLRNATPGKLVAITHQDWGAWAKHYKPLVMGIEIPDDDIRNEFRTRINRQSEKRSS